jgi:hypothetical protein
VFTPASFELIILELGELGIIDWRVDRIVPRGGVEFVVHLRRGRRLFPSSDAFERHRLELLRDTMRDLRAQADALLGGMSWHDAVPSAGVLRSVILAAVPLGLRRKIARLRSRIR